MPTKEQFMKSETYRKERDLISALLEDGKDYKPAEVDKMITRYKKGRVS